MTTEGERPRTDAENAALREKAVAYLASRHLRAVSITCDTCSERRTCEFAFDPYNTDGDCLASK